MPVAMVTASTDFSQKINKKLHFFLTFIQPKLDYISSKYLLIEQIEIILCLRKNKYSSLIIALLVLLAANGGWGIQVSETPFAGIFKGIMSFRAVSLTYLNTTTNQRRTSSMMN